MRFTLSLFLVLIFGLVQSCDQKECCILINGDNIAGEYRVFEYGYSPGDRYIIEEVPENPAQLLNFGVTGEFSSNYSSLTEYKYYKVYEHPNEGDILALFKEPPPTDNGIDLNTLDHSYMMEIEGTQMKLYYRYCIEGCHIGVRRIK